MLPLLLAVLLLVVTTIRYLRSGLSPAAMTVMVVIRIFAILLLLAAYYQPAVRFHRLVSDSTQGVILVDNSRSMRRFDAAEKLQNVLNHARSPKRPTAFHMMQFGDSLRPPGDTSQLFDFSDHRSYLPTEPDGTPLSRASRVLLVSDGNWSNPHIPASVFEDAECYYVPLSSPAILPSIRLEVPEKTVESVHRDTVTVPIVFAGTAPESTSFDVACWQGARRVSRRTVSVDSGAFRDTVQLYVPTHRLGTHLCRVNVTTDSLQASGHFRHSVIPRVVQVATYAAHPTVDSRFLRLALKRQEGWEEVPTDASERPDVLILFSWDETARKRVAQLGPRGLVLFAGCAPCTQDREATPQDGSLVMSPEVTELDDLPRSFGVPAPSGILTCDSDLRRRTVLFHYVSKAGKDSTPVVSTGEYARHAALVVTARDFWRWDFWTRSQHDDIGSLVLPFSSAVLELARQRFIAGLTDAFLAYPLESPVQESREITLVLTVPVSRDWSTPGEGRLVVRTTNDSTVLDTALTVKGGDVHNRVLIALPRLDHGAYAYTAHLRHGSRTYRYADTLTVERDRSEEEVTAQNVHLLSRIARPLSPTDTAAMQELFSTTSTGEQTHTAVTTIRIEQTWYILGAVFLLLFAEWLLRRRLRLD